MTDNMQPSLTSLPVELQVRIVEFVAGETEVNELHALLSGGGADTFKQRMSQRAVRCNLSGLSRTSRSLRAITAPLYWLHLLFTSAMRLNHFQQHIAPSYGAHVRALEFYCVAPSVALLSQLTDLRALSLQYVADIVRWAPHIPPGLLALELNVPGLTQPLLHLIIVRVVASLRHLVVHLHAVRAATCLLAR